MSGRVIPFHQRFDRRFTGFATSKDRSDRPEKTVCPSSTWRTCQFDRTESDSDRVTAFPTRYPPSVSTDRPGIGSDRIWVRSFANTGQESKLDCERLLRVASSLHANDEKALHEALQLHRQLDWRSHRSHQQAQQWRSRGFEHFGRVQAFSLWSW